MPADDLVLNVRQIAGYPSANGVALATDDVLLQRGGLGGPYLAIAAENLVGTAMQTAVTPLQVGMLAPPDASGGQMFAQGMSTAMGGFWHQNAYFNAPQGEPYRIANGPAAVLDGDPTLGWRFYWGAAGGALTPIDWMMQLFISPTGYLTVGEQVLLARDPNAPMEAATAGWVQANTVTSFMGRTGAVNLWINDILAAGGAPLFSPVFGGCPRAPTPDESSNSSRIATTAFVQRNAVIYIQNLLDCHPFVFTFNGRSGEVVLTDADIEAALSGGTIAYAPLASPNFSGVPTAPTPPPTSSDGQIATTAFVMNAVTDSTTGVVTFNGRSGVVVLNAADLTAAGGAILASPAFTGVPTAPTAAPGNNSTQIATTAYVMAATGGGGSFAPLNSPAFTGVPTAPTAATATNTTQLATTAFVMNEINAVNAGVVSFNGRTGVVNLIANDISAAGGAILASPAFTGVPTAPTAAPATNSTQIATTAYVTSAISAIGGVSTFNGRQGAVVLTTADLNTVGGPFLPLVGGSTGPLTVSSPFTVSASTGSVNLYMGAAASGQPRNLNASLNGVLRWTMQLGNGAPESGGNVGSDFSLVSFADNGTTQLGSLVVTRANVNVGLSSNSPTVTLNKNSGTNGGSILIGGQTAGAQRWSLFLGNGGTESGNSAGSIYALQSFTDQQVVQTCCSATRNPNQMAFTNAIVNGSDARMKENIRPIADALAKVMALRGVTFNRITRPGHDEIGLIAQEVREVVPEVVEEMPPLDDAILRRAAPSGVLLGISYGELTALLIEAIKGLATKLEAVEARMT